MIVDANILVYWSVDTPLSRRARRFLGRSDLIAPALIRLEAANALLAFLRAGQILKAQLQLAIQKFDAALSEAVQDAVLLDAAVELAATHKHKIYDCLYLALALQRQVPLATADRRLATLARQLSIETHLIEPDPTGTAP